MLCQLWDKQDVGMRYESAQQAICLIQDKGKTFWELSFEDRVYELFKHCTTDYHFVITLGISL